MEITWNPNNSYFSLRVGWHDYKYAILHVNSNLQQEKIYSIEAWQPLDHNFTHYFTNLSKFHDIYPFSLQEKISCGLIVSHLGFAPDSTVGVRWGWYTEWFSVYLDFPRNRLAAIITLKINSSSFLDKIFTKSTTKSYFLTNTSPRIFQ